MFTRPQRLPKPARTGSLRGQFSTTCSLQSPVDDHYSTLSVPTQATASEIKQAFYSLSKQCHPDRNPDDPTAASKFSRISAAYSVLGNATKRQRYDRDLARTSPSFEQKGGVETGQAGGRPASGLSRRRTQFRGPPASFYRNGGWGVHTERRKQQTEAGRTHAGDELWRRAAPSTGTGPYAQQWGLGDDVRHFDRESHYRTQEHIDGRRRRSLKRERIDGIGPAASGGVRDFFLVAGSLCLAMLVPIIAFGRP
ncbi:MAG: hypothetical protein M1814_001714 [Vezdaea aestivalis]|nr:MAG: hypothetical protein M1814_001714 [Vezdaea aestivalis]